VTTQIKAGDLIEMEGENMSAKNEKVKIHLEVPKMDIELLMEHFRTKNPKEALTLAIDWAALNVGISQLGGTMLMEGFDEKGNPK
jgi:hypothetical protein